MDREQTINFLNKNTLVSSEVCDLLEISKQRVAKLTNDKILVPFKESKNGNLYYRSDILRYKYERLNKSAMGNHMYNYVQAKFLEGVTRKALQFFSEHISEFDRITNAYFYFTGMDAAIDGYYILDTISSENGLYNLTMPSCVIKDKNGQQMWLKGVNCGYGGTGPSGSVKLLTKLGVEESQTYSIFEKRVVKFIRDDDKWESIVRDAAVDEFDSVGRDISASLHYKEGNLVLLQDKRHYAEHRGVDYVKKYEAFVPDIKKMLVIPDKETARKKGYYKENPYGSLSPIDCYQVILVDASGRELWLNAELNERTRISSNEDILQLVDMCGFGYEKKEENVLIQLMNKLIFNKAPEITYIL